MRPTIPTTTSLIHTLTLPFLPLNNPLHNDVELELQLQMSSHKQNRHRANAIIPLGQRLLCRDRSHSRTQAFRARASLVAPIPAIAYCETECTNITKRGAHRIIFTISVKAFPATSVHASATSHPAWHGCVPRRTGLLRRCTPRASACRQRLTRATKALGSSSSSSAGN